MHISDMSCDFHTNGVPPNSITCPHLDFTDCGELGGSLPNNPAKSASTQHAKLQLLFTANTSPLSIVPFENCMIDLMAPACDTFGSAVNLATQLTANAVSGLVLFETCDNIPTTLVQFQSSFSHSSPLGSEPKAACIVGV